MDCLDAQLLVGIFEKYSLSRKQCSPMPNRRETFLFASISHIEIISFRESVYLLE